MTEVLEDIKYFSLTSYMDFLKIEREMSNDLEDLKAIVFIMSENFHEEHIPSQYKNKIIDWLCCLDVISIVVINCSISNESIEYLLCFDLCLETTKSSISFNAPINTDYFTHNHIELLLGNQYNLYREEVGSMEHSTDFSLVNERIGFENIELSLKEFVAPILEGKTREYIRFLKKYFNLYKQNKDINRALLQCEETISFCELSLKKCENG